MWLLFYVGACLGSFFACLGWRLPEGRPVINSRSACDTCKRTLKWYELLPLFSYFFSKGRCRSCGAKIPVYHLLAEIAGGLAMLVTLSHRPQDFLFLWVALFSIAFFVSDIFYFELPDILMVLFSLGIGIYIAYDSPESFVSHLATGLGCFFLLYVLYQISDQKIGGGDVKLIGALGLLLGPSRVVWCLFIASFAGILTFLLVKSMRKLPFGPYLLTAALFLI